MAAASSRIVRRLYQGTDDRGCASALEVDLATWIIASSARETADAAATNARRSSMTTSSVSANWSMD
jgi:hypothetical protein